MKNSVGKLGLGLDIRGAGGYVIVPPSGHPSGGHYTWKKNSAKIAEPPTWLLELIAPKPEPVANQSPLQTNSSQVESRYDNVDANLAPIVARCSWMRHCRDHADSLPEPEWYAMLSILSRCQNGYNIAHEWSAGHKKYNPTETDLKLQQALAKSGPRTCDDIKANFGDTYCQGCPERVKSPIVLGREEILPTGFLAKADGIYYRVEDSKGNVTLEKVCSPLSVMALTRNADGLEWGRLIEVTDPDGQSHQWAMPMELLAGSGEECRRVLLSMGLRIAPNKGPVRLNMLLSSCRPLGRVRCVDRIGWHNGQFVLPDEVFGHGYGESVILQSEQMDNPFKTLGTLPEWQEHIGRYCVGNTRLTLAVSTALAATLLNIAEAESGGLHLVGGSSLGKTTALAVAGSVCGGGGLRGYIRQWRATANGLEGIAAAHCDSLLCLDELSQVASKEAAETAYMLGNSTGKTRANKKGAARKPAEWRTLFLSTGEITLADKIHEDGKGRATAGQAVRVVDIEADAGAGFGLFEDLHGFPDGDAFARHLKEATSRFYGTPLRAFLQQLTANLDETSCTIPAFIKDFVSEYCPAAADGQVKRVCARFALVAAGGELGIAYGILPLPKGEATRAAASCFLKWLMQRGNTGAAEFQAGIAQVRAFIQAHGSSRFETWGEETNDSKTINRVGWRKMNANGEWEYYVTPSMFKTEIAKGHDARKLVQVMVSRGLIIPGNDGGPSVGLRIPGQPNTRYYRFASSIAADEKPMSDINVSLVSSVTAVKLIDSHRYAETTTTVTTVADSKYHNGNATSATKHDNDSLQTDRQASSHATIATDVTYHINNHAQDIIPLPPPISAEAIAKSIS